MEARGAVYTIGIKQRHGRHVKVGASCNQAFGQRSAFEKTKSRTGMKFDVRHQLQLKPSPQRKKLKIKIKDQRLFNVFSVPWGEMLFKLFQSYVPSTNQAPPSRSCPSR